MLVLHKSYILFRLRLNPIVSKKLVWHKSYILFRLRLNPIVSKKLVWHKSYILFQLRLNPIVSKKLVLHKCYIDFRISPKPILATSTFIIHQIRWTTQKLTPSTQAQIKIRWTSKILPKKPDHLPLLHRMHQPQDRLLNRHAQPLILSRPHYSAADEVRLGLPAVLNI